MSLILHKHTIWHKNRDVFDLLTSWALSKRNHVREARVLKAGADGPIQLMMRGWVAQASTKLDPVVKPGISYLVIGQTTLKINK